MPISTRIKRQLDALGIQYQTLQHPRAASLTAGVQAMSLEPTGVLEARVLVDRRGLVMAVIPHDRSLDIARLNQVLHRDLQPLSDAQMDRLFNDCEAGAHPPAPGVYGLVGVIDKRVNHLPSVYLQSGCNTTLLQLTAADYKYLTSGCVRADISYAHEREQNGAAKPLPSITRDSVEQRLDRLYRLPPMPLMAVKILELVSDPHSHVRDLAKVVEQDPSLAAQIMRYARSALFNFQGNVRSIQEAINQVLGFDRVSHIALGLAAAKAFTVERGGPIGLNAFWRHGLYVAVLMQNLARHLPDDCDVEPDTAYLVGLLHNFGLLLIGHLFPPEFNLLNKLVAADPSLPIARHERQIFGMDDAQSMIGLGHGRLGAVLLEKWNLPAPVVVAAAQHQQISYQGEHQAYVTLLRLVNVLLKPLGLGDELDEESPQPYIERLGMNTEQVIGILEDLLTHSADIDLMANQVAA